VSTAVGLAGLSARESQLLADRVPFVHATVVRAQIPASVHAGDGAIILRDGSIEGFVGGQCTESAVRMAALNAIGNGESILLRVLPEGGAEFPETPGARVVVNPCHSGGALEIFLQPRLPGPLLFILGRSPIAEAVAQQSEALGFVIRREDDEHGYEGATAVLVSSHGGDEAGMIRAALDAGVGYVGLVASRRRGAVVLAELELTDAERGRIHSPAGLDIGARNAPEVALSILAEIIKVIRTEGLTTWQVAESEAESAAADRPAQAVEAIDPVCGMTVRIGPATPHLTVGDYDHWFCGNGCRDRYAKTVKAER
jgi:xanthine dehydrogenase accessory factor